MIGSDVCGVLDRDTTLARRAIVQQSLRRRPQPRNPSTAWTRRQVIPSLLELNIERRHGFAPENIPQELPDQWFRIFWTDADCPFPPHSRRFRRTAAILLAQAAAGDMNAQQAAEFLGFPPGTD
ncbi:hypothetical protein [Kitasatospora sp. NBC_01302]|uniref:hypothetical protein n=1 Tax=Kitasatospora sp. NBC_01302 TaxID=2903575 RepID=UPI002E14A7CD|nr:hypothetical protein OG294_39710 [Kitasatospora sp. NBC_01302]